MDKGSYLLCLLNENVKHMLLSCLETMWGIGFLDEV